MLRRHSYARRQDDKEGRYAKRVETDGLSTVCVPGYRIELHNLDSNRCYPFGETCIGVSSGADGLQVTIKYVDECTPRPHLKRRGRVVAGQPSGIVPH